MPTDGPTWWQTTEARFARAAGHPLQLTMILFLARSIAQPYAGLIHDAQLYGVQAINRATEGRFDGDLFLMFGSQDQYSLFSLIAAPLVSLLGIQDAFYLLYLACSCLFLYAQTRLVLALVPHRTVAVLSLIALTVGNLTYGGWGIFAVHEPFLTARLPACALALVALERLLAYRPGQAWVAAAVGMTLHPLMIAPVVGVILCWHAWFDLPRRSRSILAFVSALSLSVGGLAYLSGLVPIMDDAWFQTTRRISPQCFPSDWRVGDWLNIGFAYSAFLLAWRHQPISQRFLVASVAFVATLGLAVSLLAEVVPVPILVQGQAMRGLWVLEFLAIPFALASADRVWREHSSGGKLLAILLVFWACRLRRPERLELETFWPLVMICVATCIAFLWITRRPTGSERSTVRWHGAMAGVVLATILAAMATLIACLLIGPELVKYFDPLAVGIYSLRATGNALPMAIGLAVVLWCLQPGMVMRPIPALILPLLVTTALTRGLHQSITIPDGGGSVPFVAETIGRNARTTTPTIYWPTDIRNIWFDLEARSYYHFAQVQGALFRRETAAETNRRMDLVSPFELRRMHQRGPATDWSRLERMFERTRFRATTERDLLELAQDPSLDFVVLSDNIAGRATATDGHVWIYDCRQLRQHRDQQLVRSNEIPIANDNN